MGQSLLIITILVSGLAQPDEAGAGLYFALEAVLSWFVFPPSRRAASVAFTLAALAAMVGLTFVRAGLPPAAPKGVSMAYFIVGNRVQFFLLLTACAIYASREVARAERDLIVEREKTEHLLKQEVRHQVAERSRELGEVLARGDAPLAAAVPMPGDRFHGRYRVCSLLGAGGMGRVYDVERVTDGQRLALKVMTLALSGEHAARFAREAEIGARVQHGNVVSIVDVGIASTGIPFLVMELVRGGSLEDRRSRFGDATWALPILKQIAAGLAELHARGIVHRDLKPANVLLVDGDGDQPLAKISDFGISRFGALDNTDTDQMGATLEAIVPAGGRRELTQADALLGTPFYMPPEAWRGPARNPSADMFSFGILAYEALAGRAPFAVPALLLERAGQPIRQPTPIAGVTDVVASFVLACLHVDPAQRPRAKELAALT